jgi:hypothetical protein
MKTGKILICSPVPGKPDLPMQPNHYLVITGYLSICKEVIPVPPQGNRVMAWLTAYSTP